MAEIRSRGAVTNCIEEVIYSGKPNVFRCYSPQNPHYFKNDAGLYQPIDITATKQAMSKADVSMLLADQNIYSVGFRTDNNREKCIGIRPADKQDGSEQFEISIESIEFDGKDQNFDTRNIRVLAPTLIGNDTIAVQTTRQRTRQLVRVEGAIKSFRIVYRFHVKGLTVTEIDDEYHFHNDQKQFRFKIGKPYLVDERLEPLIDTEEPKEYVWHILIDEGDGTYTYIKESTKDFTDAEIKGQYYIDADVVYSTTADGNVDHNGLNYNSTRTAGTGSAVATNQSYDSVAMSSSLYAGTYYFTRSFFYHDLSLLSGSVSSASTYIRGYTNAVCKVTLQKGTQGNTLSTADFDSFTGNTIGDSGDWSSSAYNEIALNSDGLTAVSDALGGTLKIAARDTKDYAGTAPTSSGQNSGCYYADNSGTSYDPYIEITFSAGRPRTVHIPIRRIEPYKRYQ